MKMKYIQVGNLHVRVFAHHFIGVSNLYAITWITIVLYVGKFYVGKKVVETY
jgi:hypothetical protein